MMYFVIFGCNFLLHTDISLKRDFHFRVLSQNSTVVSCSRLHVAEKLICSFMVCTSMQTNEAISARGIAAPLCSKLLVHKA